MSDVKRNFLHVYGQYSWHGEAVIVGDTASLLKLREAIDNALNSDAGKMSAEVGCDGEGFDTIVVKLDDPELWVRLATPYTDEMAAERRKDAVSPWDLPAFRKLLGLPVDSGK